MKSMKYTLLTIFLGWWAIPFGIIFSIESICKNILGGSDLTQNLMAKIDIFDIINPVSD
ncbi:MAG: hypothetical protein ACTFAL_13790 [Candidatus Electronema sp. V4]|uniref:hypothetical protein n=1 Tax=Candidatus Electronema sp. V4 TaxID=3454756 RepID=UPI004055963D